jgi:NAD(P)H-nitrite reductase large subunit
MEIKGNLLEQKAVLQRDKKSYAVAPHIPGGIITDFNVLRTIADVAEKYNAQALKITGGQRIAIVGIEEDKIEQVWEDLGMDKGHAIGLCLHGIKICPATDFCKFGQQDAVALGLELDKKYYGVDLPGKLKMGISGCMNSCSEPAIKDIGIMGTPKGYTVMIGGNAGIRPRLADKLFENIKPDEVLPAVDKIIKYYQENAKSRERMARMVERLGIEKIKQDMAE